MRIIISLSVYILLFFLFTQNVYANFSKLNSNPLLSINLYSWDSKEVTSPSVIYNGQYQIYYGGNNTLKRNIGMAVSNDNLTYEKYENPIFKWNTISNDDVGVEHPSILLIDNIYKIWFSNVLKNYTDFKIFYSVSFDGITFWQTPHQINLEKVYDWDKYGIGAPSVIYINNVYKLWYVAKGTLSNRTDWRIGHATSPDGINWKKHPLPVLDRSQWWEGSHVANPSVIFDNGLYHMFYHASQHIGHAVSADGINWVKDPANPILTNGPSEFDSKRVLNPFIFKDKDKYYLYYTGENQDGQWQIGVASADSLTGLSVTPLPSPTPDLRPSPSLTPNPTVTQAIPNSTPSPTPTASPTLSPFPTFTPSPTPTATLIPVKPLTAHEAIIFLPGMGASWNPRDFLRCEFNHPYNWNIAPYVHDYDTLIKMMEQLPGIKRNKNFFVYGYDWRQNLDKNADYFGEYLYNLKKDNPSIKNFRLIGHSMGGLVARSFITKYPNTPFISGLLTVGSPHLGAVPAFYIWNSGSLYDSDMAMTVAFSHLLRLCRNKRIPFELDAERQRPYRRINEVTIVRNFVPSVKDLLPVFDYLKKDGQIINWQSLKSLNGFLNNYNFNQESLDFPLWTLSGKDHTSERYINIVDRTSSDTSKNLWEDGHPTGKETTLEGDGTVLNLSSKVEGANNISIKGDHGQIVTKEEAFKEIRSFLQVPSAAVTPAIREIPEKTLSISLTNEKTRISLTGPLSISASTDTGFIFYENPRPGKYTLNITPLETTHEEYLNIIETEENKVTFAEIIRIRFAKNRNERIIFRLR